MRAALIALALIWAAPAHAFNAVEFLIQHVCLDRHARPVAGAIPVIDGCAVVAPAHSGLLPYRSMDWRRGGRGVQASDSVLMPGGRAHHTFDFGAMPGREFGRFDPHDGGDEVRWTDLQAWIASTQDGGTAGVQYWADAACDTGSPLGWVLWFTPPAESWAAWNHRLGQSASADACPSGYSPVQTRWRRMPITLPWHDGERGGRVTLDAVLSIHCAGGPCETAWGGEWFIHARHLGRVMWGSFVSPERAAPHDRDARMAGRDIALLLDQRCAGEERQVMAIMPGGHVATDCRLHTQFSRTPAIAMEWMR